MCMRIRPLTWNWCLYALFTLSTRFLRCERDAPLIYIWDKATWYRRITCWPHKLLRNLLFLYFEALVDWFASLGAKLWCLYLIHVWCKEFWEIRIYCNPVLWLCCLIWTKFLWLSGSWGYLNNKRFLSHEFLFTLLFRFREHHELLGLFDFLLDLI